MKTETAIMERLIQIIESDEPLSNPLFNRYQVYRDMVYHRFYETITNVYPILSRQLGEQLSILIREFQHRGATSVLMSAMAYEFGEFLKNHCVHETLPYLDDVLWTEWGEMELLLEKFEANTLSFEWNGRYKLSSSARLRQLSYPIYRGDFESLGAYPLLLYYDFNEERVYFEEITPLGYDLLILLENNDIEEALSEIALRYEVNSEDLKEPLEQLLMQWCNKKILMKEV
ncbi:MAG: HvfC family peptide modification chaperone [Sulfuricurvum sp.]